MPKPIGPLPADVFILLDQDLEGFAYPFGGYQGRSFLEDLTAAGYPGESTFRSCVINLPLQDLYDDFIKKLKKAPAPDWIPFEDLWVHPTVAEGILEARRQLEACQPRLVIACGPLASLAAGGPWSIHKWHGSRICPPDRPYTIVPTWNPAQRSKQPDLAFVQRIDLRRAADIVLGKQLPRNPTFTLAPSYATARDWIQSKLALASKGPLKLACDIETSMGHIDCIGFTDALDTAICIPFVRHENDSLKTEFFYNEAEHTFLVYWLRKLFLHPNIIFVGQNFTYDCQYIYYHWKVIPQQVFDTMIGHHSMFSGLRKGLDFLSFMYCHDHVYWKDESKNWDPKLGERQYWTYNGKDNIVTLESADGIEKTASDIGIRTHFNFQQSLFHPMLRIMLRGCRIDLEYRAKLRLELMDAIRVRQEQLDFMAGEPLNVNSPKQLINFFYTTLGFESIRHMIRGTVTADADALNEILNREPALRPLIQCISEIRSLGVFLSTFIEAELDPDKRIRTEYVIAGPITYRFSSRKNAFGKGMNMQNIPVEEKKKLIRAKAPVKMPNVRSLIIPDPGCTFFDLDLDRADLQVVVWEAEDDDLKMALRRQIDLHLFNAMGIFGFDIPLDELVEGHPNLPEHKARYKVPRGKTKAGVHATNYGVGDRKLSQVLGVTVKEAADFRARWFDIHPGVKRWHKRTEKQAEQGYIENRLGARFYIFGRLDLPQLLGWLPQSTVAGVINRGLVELDRGFMAREHNIQLQIQVHDSIAGQFPTNETVKSLQCLKNATRVVIPYDDPLIIPTGIQTSTRSWGMCKESPDTLPDFESTPPETKKELLLPF